MTLPETRSQVIERHLRALLRETRTSWPTLASRVVEHYHARTPLHARAVRFHVGGDAYDDMRANAQLLRRWFDEDTNARLPADLEEAVVLALDEPYRARCLEDLAARYGLLAVPAALEAGAAEFCDHRRLAGFMREAGEAAAAVARMLDDGRIGPEDQPLVEATVNQLRRALARGFGLIARITSATRKGGGQ